MEGPQFSTVAESRMHRGWGGDLLLNGTLLEGVLAPEAVTRAVAAVLAANDRRRRIRDAGRSP